MQDADSIIGAEQTGNPNWPELPAEMWETIMGYLERKEIDNLIIAMIFSEGTENIIEGLCPITKRTNIIGALLSRAVVGNCLKTLEALLLVVDINKKYKRGNTLLHKAARKGPSETIEFLAKRGADINAKNAKGEMPLYLAVTRAYQEESEALEALFKDVPDINCGYKGGSTLLHLVVQAGGFETRNSKMIKFLVDKGADTNTKNAKGETPLDIALMRKKGECVAALLSVGAKFGSDKDYSEAIKCTYKNHRTLLYCATKTGCINEVQTLVVVWRRINDDRDQEGRTPLYAAAENGHLDVVKFLCDNGADVDSRDKESMTPLYVAAKKGRLDVVRFLLDQRQMLMQKMWMEKRHCMLLQKTGHLDLARFLRWKTKPADILDDLTIRKLSNIQTK